MSEDQRIMLERHGYAKFEQDIWTMMQYAASAYYYTTWKRTQTDRDSDTDSDKTITVPIDSSQQFAEELQVEFHNVKYWEEGYKCTHDTTSYTKTTATVRKIITKKKTLSQLGLITIGLNTSL